MSGLLTGLTLAALSSGARLRAIGVNYKLAEIT
jgi:hypothetical protein